MPYSFSLVTPSPSWAAINAITGAVTFEPTAMPPAGYSGFIKIRCFDGANEAFDQVAITLQPRYAVVLDYRETSTSDWRSRFRSTTSDRVIQPPIFDAWKTRFASTTRDRPALPPGAATEEWKTRLSSTTTDEESSGGGGS
jgi:hypothetical protein